MAVRDSGPQISPKNAQAPPRLDSWKEIAAYLKVSERSARRWEKTEGLPVHRHRHQKRDAVYADPAELDAWWSQRGPRLAEQQRAETLHQRRLPWRVSLPILAVVLAVAVFLTWQRQRLFGPAATPITSLAVLPLQNLSGDPEQEYFADGMTDALISELGKISALKVISRTSAMQYKGAKKPLPQIARELGVEGIVEGSVLREGDQVRINVQLLHGPTDRHLWSESYQRETHSILALQSEVARAIAAEIRVKVTLQEERLLANAHAVDPEAHELYLRGRYFWAQWSVEGFRKAVGYFEQATARDPSYAAAYAGLADAYSFQSFYGLLEPQQGIAKAETAALRALQLDETLAEAHASLGLVKQQSERDWNGARREFKRAVELEPNSTRARQLHAWHLAFVGLPEAAIAEIKRARDLDPLSPVTNAMMAAILYMARRYGESIEQSRTTLELDPNFHWAHHLLGEAYIEKGMYPEALVELRKSNPLGTSNPHFAAALGYLHARAGRRAQALEVIGQLKATSNRTYVPPSQLAIIYAGLNEKEEALHWLEKGYQERDTYLTHIKVGPYFDPLRDEPRFQALLQRMNFPE